MSQASIQKEWEYLDSPAGTPAARGTFLGQQLSGLSSAINNIVIPQTNIADLGATTNLAASNFTAAIAAAPTKAEIDVGIDVLKGHVETRLDNIEAKVDALLAALRSAGILA
jgi:hypothetical protein